MRIQAAIALAAVVLTSGCYTMNAQLPGTVRGDVDASQTESAGRVEIEKTNWFYLWGLVGAPPPDFFAGELKKQVKAKGADGVKNLTYEAQFGCVDLFIGGLTLGCVAPRTYKLTGEVVKLRAPTVPGKPLAGAPATAAATPNPGPEQLAQTY